MIQRTQSAQEIYNTITQDSLPINNKSFGSYPVKMAPEGESKLSKSCPDIYTCTARSEKAPSMCFIGRIQPTHVGHLRIVSEMSKKADHLIIVIGSADKEKTEKNPYSALQRKEMMRMSIKDHKKQNPDKWNQKISISYIEIPDMERDIEWNNALKAKVVEADKAHTNSNKKERPGNRTIAIAGCEKDASTASYLKNLSNQTGFTLEILSPLEDNNGQTLNATDLRKILFDKSFNRKISDSDQSKLSLSITPSTLGWINNNLQQLKDCK